MRIAIQGKTARRRPPSPAASSVSGRSAFEYDFQNRATRCTTECDLRDLLAGAAHELGFRYFALLHHNSLGDGRGRHIRIDNYPGPWERELIERVVLADDPVHQASLRTNIGFLWDDLSKLVPLNRNQQAILRRAHHFGIIKGFTVPANVPGEPSGSCSFAGRSRKPLSRAALTCAELVGAHAFYAARRIRGYTSTPSRPHLSRRECECLRLLAAGKTDWEIAAILGLSPETVHHYVKRARAAYDVVSRTQLVVNGLRDGWISFNDAASLKP